MVKPSRYELLVFVLIVAVAIFFRFYHLGFTPWTASNTTAVIGVLTVIGLYMLVKEMFDWHIAALSSFVMAISFWHVSLSRAGLEAVTVPFMFVYVFHFLWRGFKNMHLTYFFWAGVLGGLGFYTELSYWTAPFIAIALFITYWKFLKNTYDHSKYEYIRNQLLRGFALTMIVAFIVVLPLAVYFIYHPEEFMKESGLSIFNQLNPLQALGISVRDTLGMFNFSDNPMLSWPIGIFFIIGFIKEFGHWLERKHGHLSPLHTFIFAWFFITLLPGFFTSQAPNILLTIGALPVAMIFTGRGSWWFFKAIGAWRDMVHPTEQYHLHHLIDPAAVITIVLLLTGFASYEYHHYFNGQNNIEIFTIPR